MQLNLTDMVPKLKETAEDTEAKMEIVTTEKVPAGIFAVGNKTTIPSILHPSTYLLLFSSIKHLESRNYHSNCHQRRKYD